MEKKPLSILIADDDEGDLKQIKRALKKSSLVYEISEAKNAEEALSLCEKNQSLDCIILDYQMPGQSGLSAITALRECLPYVAIIMVTGQGDEEIASEAFKRGVADYLPKKAIQAESIERIIKSAIEKMDLHRKVDEQRDALKNFARVLTHDLSAPLRHIESFSELITTTLKKKEYKKALNYCERVIKAGKRMKKMIDTLSEYNKLTGREIIFEPVLLQTVLKNTLDHLSVLIKEKNVKITHDALPEVIGNETQLIQLFQNLIGNSIKYCNSKSPMIHITSEKKNNDWCISVKDNGIGIPEEFYQAIFNPFKRLHSGEDEYSGTGLGLAICKKIIERHNGKIWCESKKNQGTTFFFKLNTHLKKLKTA